jgi:hypothetical protein
VVLRSIHSIWLSGALLLVWSCAPVKLDAPNPGVFQAAVVESHQRLRVPAAGIQMVDTGVDVRKGQLLSIIASGEIRKSNRVVASGPGGALLNYSIGSEVYGLALWGSNEKTWSAQASGRVYLGISDGAGFNPETKRAYDPERYDDNYGSLVVDIIVWGEANFLAMAEVVGNMLKAEPAYLGAKETLKALTYLQRLDQRQKEVLAAVEDAQSQIIAIEKAKKRESAKEPSLTSASNQGPDKDTEVLAPVLPERQTAATKPQADSSKESLVGVKMNRLADEIEKLEALYLQLHAARVQTEALADELDLRTAREKALLERLRNMGDAPPVIVIATPQPDSTVEVQVVTVTGVAEDDNGVQRIEIWINGKPIPGSGERGIVLEPPDEPKRLDFQGKIPLVSGDNRVTVRAYDPTGVVGEKTFSVKYAERKKRLWAVVVGINSYPRVRPLKYAVNDARSVHDYLVDDLGVSPENVVLLIDEQATLSRLRSVLGTRLKQKAAKDDLVIIFFAGHGATERDSSSPDGDGLEKYILPFDVDPSDLYATALPMGEIARIFNRIGSDRLLFIADACYSGAAGGRSIGIEGVRSNMSDAFMERVASGKGRIILSASGANEVSVERDHLQHGVFTYLMVKGLKGQADLDNDKYVTLEELYRYLSIHVPRMTQQAQHPVKKGSTEGQLVVGLVPD